MYTRTVLVPSNRGIWSQIKGFGGLIAGRVGFILHFEGSIKGTFWCCNHKTVQERFREV